jgi:hypothetical protein
VTALDLTATPVPFQFFGNNRVQSYFLGLNGVINNVAEIKFQLSYSQNSGTYVSPLPKNTNQISSSISLFFPISFLNNSTIILNLYNDSGNLYKNNSGIYLALKKQW